MSEPTIEQQATHLGISVEEMEALLKFAKESEHKLSEGFRKMWEEKPWRDYRLGFLRPFRAAPHPNVGKRIGKHRLRDFTISEGDAILSQLNAIFDPSEGGRFGTPGTYTKLQRWDHDHKPTKADDWAWTVVMSDTDDELLDMWEFFCAVEIPSVKRVLINGLGLGIATRIALGQEHVEHVDVVELNSEVIKLAAPLFEGDERLEIHKGDAYTYRWPVGMKWNIAWHDIWDEISVNNNFERLHRRYGRRVQWQRSWARREAVESEKRKQKWLAEAMQKRLEGGN
jgi:hypothetical protein